MMAIGHARNKQRMGFSLVLVMTGCLFLAVGCGTINKVKNATTALVDGLGGDDNRLKKRVALIPFENWTTWQAGQLNNYFMSQFVAAVQKECPQILLVVPGDADYPESLHKLPTTDTGKVDNIALARMCQKSGINGIITGQLSHIGATQEKRGWVFLKKMHHMARLQLDVSMLHAGSAAKLMDETYYAEVDVLEADFESLQRRQAVQIATLEEPMAQAAEVVMEAVCERLNQLPWEGYVVSVDENRAVISVGESSGLRAGSVLVVYEAGKITEGNGGNRYFLPGKISGDVSVTAVSANTAEIVAAESTSPIKIGSIVRLKPE